MSLQSTLLHKNFAKFIAIKTKYTLFCLSRKIQLYCLETKMSHFCKLNPYLDKISLMKSASIFNIMHSNNIESR